jgi:hypothetical protein
MEYWSVEGVVLKDLIQINKDLNPSFSTLLQYSTTPLLRFVRFPEKFQSSVEHHIHRNRFHAPVVFGTVRFQAGAARYRHPDDPAFGVAGAGGNVVRRSDNGDKRSI